MYDRGINIIMIPGVEMWKQVWSTMDHPLPTLAAKNWTEYENLIKLHVFEKDSNQLSISLLIHDFINQGTHAKSGYLYGRDKRLAREAGAGWYRSKNPLQLSSVHYPFVGDGYLSNKKWPLNEGSAMGIFYEILLNIFLIQILAKHLLKLQQVRA